METRNNKLCHEKRKKEKCMVQWTEQRDLSLLLGLLKQLWAWFFVCLLNFSFAPCTIPFVLILYFLHFITLLCGLREHPMKKACDSYGKLNLTYGLMFNTITGISHVTIRSQSSHWQAPNGSGATFEVTWKGNYKKDILPDKRIFTEQFKIGVAFHWKIQQAKARRVLKILF